MNVKELIKQLSELDENLEIIVSSDAEGNSFSDLTQIATAVCYRNNGHEIELVHSDNADDYVEDELEVVLVLN